MLIFLPYVSDLWGKIFLSSPRFRQMVILLMGVVLIPVSLVFTNSRETNYYV